MFYSQDILQKRGGKFGIVWIAATKAGHLTKRDYSSVNIRRTCEDLVDYICVRVHAADHHSSRPRFSLYLSAQLMYGVVKVYAKQHDYLSNEVTSFSQRVLTYSAPSTAAIDLPLYRHDPLHDLPEMYEFDPTFEMFKTRFDEPEIYLRDDMQYWRLNGSPSQSPSIELPESSPRAPLIPFRPEIGSPHTVPNKAITLVEYEKELLHEGIPGDIDIPPLDENVLQSLMAGDQGIESFDEQGQEPTAGESKSKSILDETPRVPTALLEEPPALHPNERSPGLTPPQVSPVHHAHPPAEVTFELSPLVPSPRKKRALRKRQLLFADVDTTLSKATIRNNLATGKDLCMDIADAIPVAKARKIQDLFTHPAIKALNHRTLLPLWKRNCKTKRQAQEGENELWTVPHSSDFEDEILQIAEEAPIPMAEESAVSDVLRQDASLEQNLKDLSRSSQLILSPGRRSEVMQGEGSSGRKRSRLSRASSSEDEISIHEQIEMATLTHADTELGIVLEEPAQEEMAAAMDSDTSSGHRRASLVMKHDEVLQLIASETTDCPHTSFSKLCPTSNPRELAAWMFMSVLELGKQNIVSLNQRRFHGEITISRGAAW